MAGVLTLLHEAQVIGQSSATITHGLNRAGLAVQLVVDGSSSPELLVSSAPNPTDPLNQIDLVFSALVTGRIQVFGAAGDFIQLPSAAQAVQLAASAAYGSERLYTERDKPINHTSSMLKEALSLSASLEGGIYRVEWYYEWALDHTSYDFIAEIKVGSTVIGNHRQEPKDSSGSKNDYKETGSGTDQRHPVQGFWEGALPSGTHTASIYFAASRDKYAATVYRSRLLIIRVG